MEYNINNIYQIANNYLKLCNYKLSWLEIFNRIKHYLENKAQYTLTEFEDYNGFMLAVATIESTIPTYEEYENRNNQYYTQNHMPSVYRAINLFGRAFLEEIEIKNSIEVSSLQLSFLQNNVTEHDNFTGFGGQFLPDLIDKNGDTYDVKNNGDKSSFKKANGAKYILGYSITGQVIKYEDSPDLLPTYFAQCASFAELEKRYSLPRHCFDDAVKRNDVYKRNQELEFRQQLGLVF